jgi:NitT/TauT family transport system substrate-binding protein
MLGRRGLTLADVELVPLGFPDHPAALANGSIDVSTASEPFGTVAIDQGVGVRLEEDQRSIGPIQPTHFLFSEHFSTARADAATRFLAAILRANREMQGRWVDNPELAKIVEDEIGIRRDLLVRAVLPQYPLDLTPRLADIQAMQEAFLKEGHLTYSALIDVTPFVNTALAERARQLLDARR